MRMLNRIAGLLAALAMSPFPGSNDHDRPARRFKIPRRRGNRSQHADPGDPVLAAKYQAERQVRKLREWVRQDKASGLKPHVPRDLPEHLEPTNQCRRDWSRGGAALFPVDQAPKRAWWRR